MTRATLLLYVLAWSVALLWATVASAQPRGFWWYDHALGSSDRGAQMREVAAHSTHTMAVLEWAPEDWETARALGLKVIIGLPLEVVAAVSETAPQVPPLALPLTCYGPAWCGKTLSDWVALLHQHRDLVDIINLVDEKDCNSDDGAIRFPAWTPTSCARAAAKIAVLHQAVKGWLPWVRTWTNYTAAWAYYYIVARDRAVPVSRYGVSMSPSDLVSFDCYTSFATCFGRTSVAQLVDVLKPALRPDQRVILVPRAFEGAYLGWAPSVADLAVMADQYWRYAQTEPRIEAVAPFLYRDVPGVGRGARSVPAIAGIYAPMGAQVTGRVVPPPGSPINFRVVREP